MYFIETGLNLDVPR